MATPRGARHTDLEQRLRDLEAQVRALSFRANFQTQVQVPGQVVNITEILTGPNDTGRWVNSEQYTATGPGDIVWLLDHVPIPGTLRIDWGTAPQAPTEWSDNGAGEITIPDPGNDIWAGAVFTAYYEWDATAGGITPVPSPPTLSVKGTDSNQASSNVSSLAIPIPAPAAGDLILLAAVRGTPPSGWVPVTTAAAGATQLKVYKRVSDGTEAHVTLTGAAAYMSGITVVLDGSTVVDFATRTEDPTTGTSFQCPAVTGAPLSFALFDGPGAPPDEHITGADTTILENLSVLTGTYGLAAAEGRATFTGTTGDPASVWLGVTIGVRQ